MQLDDIIRIEFKRESSALTKELCHKVYQVWYDWKYRGCKLVPIHQCRIRTGRINLLGLKLDINRRINKEEAVMMRKLLQQLLDESTLPVNVFE